MTASKEYIIQLAGLSEKEHLFEFNIDDTFFKNFEYSEIEKGKLKVKLNLLNQGTMMVLNFTISGTVREHCDRCAEEFDLPIEGKNQLIIKVGLKEAADETNDDIINIEGNEQKIDLSQFIYEYITLALPSKRAHPLKSDCNKEVLKKLNIHSIEEKTETKEPSDPRWKELMNIKLN